MKSLVLDKIDEVEFVVLGINSHTKGYKLCWEMNNKLGINFIKNKSHKLDEGREFSRFTYSNKDTEVELDLITNHSAEGILLSEYKKADFFLKIQNPFWEQEKQSIIERLNQIEEVLLIFPIELNKLSSLTPFIFNDTKN